MMLINYTNVDKKGYTQTLNPFTYRHGQDHGGVHYPQKTALAAPTPDGKGWKETNQNNSIYCARYYNIVWHAIHFTLIYYFYIIYSARLRLSIGNLVGVVNYTDLVVLGSFIIHNRRMTFNLLFIIVLQQIESIQIMAKCPWALTVT